jgi:hypothetical protein
MELNIPVFSPRFGAEPAVWRSQCADACRNLSDLPAFLLAVPPVVQPLRYLID